MARTITRQECCFSFMILMALAGSAISIPTPASADPTIISESHNTSIRTTQHTEDFCGFVNPIPADPSDAGSRYWDYSEQVWVGAGSGLGLGDKGRAQPATITYSFPSDGVMWGIADNSPTNIGVPNDELSDAPLPNNLNKLFLSVFDDLDLAREYYRQSLASWSKYSGLLFIELQDDDEPMNNQVMTPSRGEIRAGGISFTISCGTRAVATLPVDVVASPFYPFGVRIYPGGSDVVFNTNNCAMVGADTSNDFRRLRNLYVHELGHQLGFHHLWPIYDHPSCDAFVVPNINTVPLTMQTFPVSSIELPEFDGHRGAQRNYGDRNAGNDTPSTSTDLGTIDSVRIVEFNLSTNGVDGANNTNLDWYRFQINASGSLNIVVIPVQYAGSNLHPGQDGYHAHPEDLQPVCGLSYQGGHPDFPYPGFIEPASAGNLNLELYESDGMGGMTMVASSTSAGVGFSESISTTLAAGDYYIKVVDVGPNDPKNQFVQLYDLHVIGDPLAKAPPFPVIGVDKRIPVGEPCFFIGDISSETNHPGATLNNASYDWDLDGDGNFETLDDPRPTYVYSAIGDVEVTLRLTDSNGMSATDSITVSVYEGPVINEILNVHALTTSPGYVWRDRDTPIIVMGENLDEFVNSLQLILHDADLVVSGTPVVKNSGAEIHGLSIQSPANSNCGQRKASVTTSIGFGSLTDAFTMTMPYDLDGNCTVDAGDLGKVILEFGETGVSLLADINGDGVVDAADLQVVLLQFGDTCEINCI